MFLFWLDVGDSGDMRATLPSDPGPAEHNTYTCPPTRTHKPAHRSFMFLGKTELIIAATNVRCLHLWVFAIISVSMYLFACKKQFARQTLGESTIHQSAFISKTLVLYVWKL